MDRDELRDRTGVDRDESAGRRFWIWGSLLAALIGSVAVLQFSRERALRDVVRVVKAAAMRHGIEPALAAAVVVAESSGNPRAVSPRQAYGLMQLRVPTASDVAGRPVSVEELFDPELNADLGCNYLRQLLDRYRGDERFALMAYNAGMGNVDRWRREAGTDDSGRILAEKAYGQTRAYVRKVFEQRERFRAEW